MGLRFQPNAQGKQPRARSLRREIVVALLLKVMLIVVLKYCFFSHPLPKAEVAAQLNDRMSPQRLPSSASLSRQSNVERP